MKILDDVLIINKCNEELLTSLICEVFIPSIISVI